MVELVEVSGCKLWWRGQFTNGVSSRDCQKHDVENSRRDGEFIYFALGWISPCDMSG